MPNREGKVDATARLDPQLSTPNMALRLAMRSTSIQVKDFHQLQDLHAAAEVRRDY
jgi:hypothetical protein